MSETKLEAKQLAHSENFRYHSENSLSWRKFAMIAKIEHCENFAMFAKFSLCLIAKIFEIFDFFFFEKQNKISNK